MQEPTSTTSPISSQSLAGAGEVIASRLRAPRTPTSSASTRSAVRQADHGPPGPLDAHAHPRRPARGRHGDALRRRRRPTAAQLKAMLATLRDGIAEAPGGPVPAATPPSPRNTDRESTGELPDPARRDRRRARGRPRPRPRRPLRGRADPRGLRQLARPAQLAARGQLQLRLVPVPRPRQGGEDGHTGPHWEAGAFARKMRFAREQLALLARPPRARSRRASYRAYLAPAAMNDILGMLCWGGFGLKSQRTKHSPLMRMADGKDALRPARVHRARTRAEGLAAGFQREGFVRPGRVELVRGGPARRLRSSRRARRASTACATNGANGEEAPESLDLAAGELPRADALKALGPRHLRRQPLVPQLLRPLRRAASPA